MDHMFCCTSKFKCDLSKWDVKNVVTAGAIFYNCPIKILLDFQPIFENSEYGDFEEDND